MSNGTADRISLNEAAQTTLRILIASYFLAVALGLIPGTQLGLLFAWAMPPVAAAALSAALVFILSFMVMTVIYARVAALLLGLMTFYASYLTMVELGVERELGGFWRDLALIAALLLTYNDSAPTHRGWRSLFHRRISPRRVLATTDGKPTRRNSAPLILEHALPEQADTPIPAPRRVRRGDEPEIENIFCEEDRFA